MSSEQWRRSGDPPGRRAAAAGGVRGSAGGGGVEVADDAGGRPCVGEADAGGGLAETEDEVVHLAEEGADLAEAGPQSGVKGRVKGLRLTRLGMPVFRCFGGGIKGGSFPCVQCLPWFDSSVSIFLFVSLFP